MDDASYGLVEIVLAFGALLAWAGFELVRNRRALARLRRERGQDR